MQLHPPVDANAGVFLEFDPGVVTLERFARDEKVVDEAGLGGAFASCVEVGAGIAIETGLFVSAVVQLFLGPDGAHRVTIGRDEGQFASCFFRVAVSQVPNSRNDFM